MNGQEALTLIDALLRTGSTQSLNTAQSVIFLETWAGSSYTQIAQQLGYEPDYVKQIGSRLWRSLSQVVGEEVTKKNLQAVIHRYQQEARSLKSLLASSTYSTTVIGEDEVRWVGREAIVKMLAEKLAGNCRVLTLVGITGIGKSSLAVRLSLEPAVAQSYPVVKIVRFESDRCTFKQFAAEILGERRLPDFEVEKAEKLVTELITYLQAHPYLLILDMVEEILEAAERGEFKYKDALFAQFFDQFIQAQSMPSRLILTSQDRLPVMAEGRYLERSHLEWLKGLEPAEALELFALWEAQPQTTVEKNYLQRIVRIYEGHPLALRVVAGEIREPPYQGDIPAYWHDYGQEIVAVEHKLASDLSAETDSVTLANYSISLSDLVKCRVERSFTRLKASFPLAYVLLCMGATYRCSVERTAWLILISESPREAQVAAFQTLQRRFLLETDSITGCILYRLHSLIRSTALEHLNNS